jgi:hypothetical protein
MKNVPDPKLERPTTPNVRGVGEFNNDGPAPAHLARAKKEEG